MYWNEYDIEKNIFDNKVGKDMNISRKLIDY